MPSEKFCLGRECVVRIDGQILSGVKTVTPKRTVRMHDATGLNQSSESTIVTHRTWELEIEVTKPTDVERLRQVEDTDGLVTVETSNGLRAVSGDFVVCECEAAEPLDEAVVAVFALKQWAHGR
jgi:hypothetical protein